jgi:hypothetical protein
VDEQDSAAELFRALVRHVKAGELELRCDFKRLRHMDCPVAVEAEGTRWAYVTIAAMLLGLWRGGWWFALAAAGIGSVLYYTIGARLIERNIRRRIDERSLGSLDDWQKLWRFGGVTLATREGEACDAPDGNWMALVREMESPSPPLRAEKDLG